MSQKKLFFVGLDAADPDLMENWMDSGQLPFFKELISEATYCRLECIPPTWSPVEWSSILTGVNPGKHGIYGFDKRVDGKVQVTNRTDRKSPALYEILEQSGKRVGMLNMTTTYPASEINRFVITGMETPDVSSPRACYPEGLIEELRSAGCDYKISPGIASLLMKNKIGEAIAALDQVAEARYRATLYLMEKYDCDVLMVLFSEIDNVSHYFWSFHDELHPDYSNDARAKYGDVLLRVYQKHDQIVRNLMRQYPEATCVICSDHGFGFNYEARYYLKELFQKLGLYVPVVSSEASSSLRRASTRTLKEMYWFMYRRFPMSYKRKIASLWPGLRGRVEFIVADTDWKRTKIYSNDDFCSITINRSALSTQEAYFDLRRDLLRRLHSLQELGTGKKLVKAIYSKEDLYSGPYVDDAPDIIIEWDEVRLRSGIRCGDVVIKPEDVRKSDLQKILSGEHRPQGILIMKGDMIRTNHRIEDASILDIAPTVLHLLGQPIPRYMDGKVLIDGLHESFLRENPVRYVDMAPQEPDKEEFTYTDEESQEVMERLRSLGYVE